MIVNDRRNDPRSQARAIVIEVLTMRARQGDWTALAELRERSPHTAQAVQDTREFIMRTHMAIGIVTPKQVFKIEGLG